MRQGEYDIVKWKNGMCFFGTVEATDVFKYAFDTYGDGYVDVENA